MTDELKIDKIEAAEIKRDVAVFNQPKPEMQIVRHILSSKGIQIEYAYSSVDVRVDLTKQTDITDYPFQLAVVTGDKAQDVNLEFFVDDKSVYAKLYNFAADSSSTVDFSLDDKSVIQDKQVNGSIVPAAPLAKPVPPSQQQLDDSTKSIYLSNVKAALRASDTVLLRCYESGIALPKEWVTYRKDLRAIFSQKTIDPSKPLPSAPPYPTGT